MHIDFYEPPAAQKVGGLDQAIRSLRDYLTVNGFSVRVNPSGGGGGQPEVVHFHGLWQPQFLKVSRRCRQSGIPYVVSPHGMLEPWAWRHKYWKKFWYYYLFERAHLRNAAVVLATSDQEAANLSRFVPREMISTIALGLTDEHSPAFVAAREKFEWDSEELVLLFLSRIHRKKGLHLLLLALGAIAASLPEKWRLVIVGDGEEKYISQCRTCARANENVFRHTEWQGAVWSEEK
ncbi:MAG: glycosyltransferase, partial [Limisphaerales bacterium]